MRSFLSPRNLDICSKIDVFTKFELLKNCLTIGKVNDELEDSVSLNFWIEAVALVDLLDVDIDFALPISQTLQSVGEMTGLLHFQFWYY